MKSRLYEILVSRIGHGRNFVAVMMLVALISSFASAQTKSIQISGVVVGTTGEHATYVAVWDATSFLRKPVQQVRIPPNTTPTFDFTLAKGRWALSAFEDTNDNGVLDMGVFGPKEPSWFYHAFHAWRKPRFDDVAVYFDENTSGLTIKLRR